MTEAADTSRSTNPMTAYVSVEAWKTSLVRQWGGDPLAEDPAKLDTLGAFCAFLGRNPDELVDFCFLRRRETGEKFSSKKRREELVVKVQEFVASKALKGTDARRTANHIYSFLSHNGVLI